METSTRANLSGRLDAVIEEARGRVAAFQSEYQEWVLVFDTIAGINFPKFYAASTLDHGGTTCYLVSDETRREFEKRHGLTP